MPTPHGAGGDVYELIQGLRNEIVQLKADNKFTYD